MKKHSLSAILSIMTWRGLFIFSISTIFVAIFSASVLGFQNGEDAQNGVGQLDGDGNPSYTKSAANGGPNASGFYGPGYTALDESGHRLFVSDANNNRILVFNLDNLNNPLDYLADFVLGQADFVSGNADTSQNQFISPQGLVYDGLNNRLFVADSGNNRVMVFDTTVIVNGENAINVLGQADFTSSGSSATQNTLYGPVDLTYNSDNNQLFVSDSGNNRVLVFDVAVIVDGENAINVLGQFDDNGNPSYTKANVNNAPNAFGLSDTRFNAFDAVGHRLFVSDGNRILVFNLDVSNDLIDYTADFVLGQATFGTNVAGGGLDGLNNVNGLAYDSNNNRLFAADYAASRVLVFDVAAISNGEAAINVLGQGGTLQSTFTAQNIAYDNESNRLFVADVSVHRVLIFDVAAIVDNENAVNVLGQENFETSGSSTTQSTFNGPVGLVYDTVNNRLFVADQSNHRVMVFDLTIVTDGEAAVNVLGQADFVTGVEGVTQDKLSYPGGLAYDSATQRLFVADMNNRRIVNFDVTAIVDGEDAVNVLGQEDFVSRTNGTTQDTLYNPLGISYDALSDHLFVSDWDNNRVIIFDVAAITDGENAVDSIGQTNDDLTLPIYTKGNDSNTPLSKSLSAPQSLALNTTTHQLFVSDANNSRILVFNLDGTDNIIEYSADYVLGQENFGTNLTGVTADSFSYPRGLAFNSDQTKLFVSDLNTNRILVFDITVIINGETAVNVLGQTDFISSGFGRTQGTLYNPFGLTYDRVNDQLFVADQTNNRIMIFDVGTIIDGEDAVNMLGQTNGDVTSPLYTKYLPNNVPLAVGLESPNGVDIDTINHRLFVVDSVNNRVLVFNLNLSNQLVDYTADYVLGQENFATRGTGLTQDTLTAPGYLVFDSVHGRLFVGETNNRVMVFDVAVITNGENAVNVLGQVDFVSNNSGTTQSTMTGINGLAYDSTNDRLFVVDGSNNRVMVFDVAAITDGENAVNVLGQVDFVSSAGVTGQSTFSNPAAGIYDNENSRLFVTDNSPRVMVFDVAAITDGENAVNVLGQVDFVSSGSGTTQNTFNSPTGLAYDTINERLFVGDYSNHRVMVFDVAAITDGENAVNVLGQVDFVSSDIAITQSGMSGPYDLAYNNENTTLWVSDLQLNRILEYNVAPPGVTTTQSGGTTTLIEGGVTDSYTIVLNAEPANDVTITITPDADSTVSTSSIIFSRSTWNIAQTITVTAVDDLDVEDAHTSTITHTVNSADLEYDALAVANIIANITDNDVAEEGGSGVSHNGSDHGAIPNILSTSTINSNGIVSTTPSIPTPSTPSSPAILSCMLSLGQSYKIIGSPAVYLIDRAHNIDGTLNKNIACAKRVFTRPSSYFTYFDSWAKIRVVDIFTLLQVPDDSIKSIFVGPLFSPQSGTLMKLSNGPKVYLIFGGQKHWIETESLFQSAGFSFDMVTEVTQNVFDLVSTGDSLKTLDQIQNAT